MAVQTKFRTDLAQSLSQNPSWKPAWDPLRLETAADLFEISRPGGIPHGPAEPHTQAPADDDLQL